VVLSTLVIQGLTLTPLIRLLGLDKDDSRDAELAAARADLAEAALATLKGERGLEADHLRHLYELKRDAVADPPAPDPLEDRRRLGLAIVRAERRRLGELRAGHGVGPDVFEVLQEELDFRELALTSEEERRIEES
jgi:CPA1 family monovalent cation:H+ antiporter